MTTKIKICGITTVEHACAATAAGAAALGLNFYPAGKRYIGSVDAALALIEQTRLSQSSQRAQRQDGTEILWAGVFVDAAPGAVTAAARTLGLDIVQLHGSEAPEYVAALKRALPGIQIWKAFRVAAATDLSGISAYECDALVLDAKVPGQAGGTGQVFDWTILAGFRPPAPVVLSGGLNAANVGAAIALVRPDWVDVASGVEESPGVKSSRLIGEFIRRCGGQV